MHTVLVVDADPQLLEILTDVLSDPGRTVLAAGTADEALVLVERHPVQLLVAGVKLPDMTAVELARRARAIRPGLQFVRLSGALTDARGLPDNGPGNDNAAC